ncbi:MAG: hypothetical protein V1839_04115 [archaeon]
MAISKEYVKTLEKIAHAIGTKEKWLVRGSVCLAMYGVNITPHDIDINTTKNGIYIFEKQLKNHLVKPVELSEFNWLGKKFRSLFCTFRIDDIDIEVVANWQEKIGDKWKNHKMQKAVFLRAGSVKVPVNTIKDELEHAIKRKRTDRVKQITKFLEK